VALIATVMLEKIRDGVGVAELMSTGREPRRESRPKLRLSR